MTTRRIIPAAQLRAGPAIIIVALSPRSVLGVIDPPARRSDRAAAQPNDVQARRTVEAERGPSYLQR